MPLFITGTPEDYSRLRGRTLWLTWQEDYIPRRDISLSRDARASLRERGNIHPVRLDGWKAVSPLESLAGSRPSDSLEVALRDPVLREENSPPRLIISDEPVQIRGTHRILVQFTDSSRIEALRGRPWDPARGQWGRKEITLRPEIHSGVPGRDPLRGIEEAPSNELGWFLYGDPAADGSFLLKALLPRALIRLQPQLSLAPSAGSRSYLRQENWKDLRIGRISRTRLQPEGSGALPPEGSEGLMFHLFGWKADSENPLPRDNSLVTGHVSPGLFRVVRDALSGDLILDVEYRQMYCHNREGIVAGAFQHHAYLGALDSGWLFKAPVSDTLLFHSALDQTLRVEDSLFSPLREMGRSFSRAAHHIRTGDGTGLAPVNMAANCSQDSAMALWEFLQSRWEPFFAKYRMTLPGGRDAQVEEVHRIFRRLNRFLVPRGRVPRRWRQYREGKPFSRRLSRKAGRFIDALLTWNTILPRNLHDGAAGILLAQGAEGFVLRSDIYGSSPEETTPLPPSTFKQKYRRTGDAPEGENPV